MFFSPETDSLDELFRVMLDWAFGGFKPSGPDGLRPQSEYNGMQQISTERHSLTLYFSARTVVLNFKFVVYLLFSFFLRTGFYATSSEWECSVLSKLQRPSRKII